MCVRNIVRCEATYSGVIFICGDVALNHVWWYAYVLWRYCEHALRTSYVVRQRIVELYLFAGMQL